MLYLLCILLMFQLFWNAFKLFDSANSKWIVTDWTIHFSFYYRVNISAATRSFSFSNEDLNNLRTSSTSDPVKDWMKLTEGTYFQIYFHHWKGSASLPAGLRISKVMVCLCFVWGSCLCFVHVLVAYKLFDLNYRESLPYCHQWL